MSPRDATGARRSASYHGPHWALQRDLLRQAGETLDGVRRQRQLAPTIGGLDANQWQRLRTGQAGFPLVVKAARALGLLVDIRLGQAATGDPV